MKKSSISLAILSSILLSACGGNSNQSTSSAQNTNNIAQPSSSNNKPTANNTSTSNTNSNSSLSPSQPSTLQQWDMFSLEPVNDQNYKLLVGKITIADGVLYNTNVFNEENIIYLTQQGEFVNYGPLNPKYGYEIGKVDFDGLVFKVSPYSPLQSQGLVLTINHKEINLEGENVLVSIDPELNWQINEPIYSDSTLNNATLQKLKSIQNLKFPAGAKCLKSVSDHYNQEHLGLYVIDDSYKFEFEKTLDAFNQQQKDVNLIAEDPIAKYTQFFGSTSYIYSFGSGYSLYNGKYYTTEKKDLGFDFVHAEFIQDSIDEANHFKDPVEKAARLNYAESYKKECDLYNAVAADFIKKNIKL